jgi:hypothetical protein
MRCPGPGRGRLPPARRGAAVLGGLHTLPGRLAASGPPSRPGEVPRGWAGARPLIAHGPARGIPYS